MVVFDLLLVFYTFNFVYCFILLLYVCECVCWSAFGPQILLTLVDLIDTEVSRTRKRGVNKYWKCASLTQRNNIETFLVVFDFLLVPRRFSWFLGWIFWSFGTDLPPARNASIFLFWNNIFSFFITSRDAFLSRFSDSRSKFDFVFVVLKQEKKSIYQSEEKKKTKKTKQNKYYIVTDNHLHRFGFFSLRFTCSAWQMIGMRQNLSRQQLKRNENLARSGIVHYNGTTEKNTE